jgi:hypothetical protein
LDAPHCANGYQDQADLAFTIVVPCILALSYLMSLAEGGYRQINGSATSSGRGDCGLHMSLATETAGFLCLAVHAMYGYLTWTAPHRELQLASLIVALAILAFSAGTHVVSTRARHELFRLVATVLFTAQTLLSVYETNLSMAAQVSAPILCAVYLLAALADLGRAIHPNTPICVRYGIVVLMTLGPATYALPLWGSSCDS